MIQLSKVDTDVISQLQIKDKYRDDEFVAEVENKNNTEGIKWREALSSVDKGVKGHWEQTDADGGEDRLTEAGWKPVKLPAFLWETEIGHTTGSIWFKKKFEVKAPDTEVRSDNLQVYFIVSIFIILAVSIGVAALLTMLIEWLTKTRLIVPTIVWMILLSIAMGMALSLIFSRMFISPITRLSRAMQQVAQGDFTVRLEHPGHFGEMRQSYENFNTMTRALSTIETLQSDFVSNVSHEFKTPINAIEGYAMLLQDAADPDQQREYVDKILTSTHRLGDLVNSILLLSKVYNQSYPAEKTAYRLDEQLRRALLMLEGKWAPKELELDVELAPVTYTGNENLLLHVWTNLLDNAIKFSPRGGLLRLRMEQDGPAVRVSVEDRGVGMTAEEMSHIFDRFYQADGSHKSEGNGLGLPLVKRIVEGVEGGVIRVESQPGRGSRFVVTLKNGNAGASVQ